MSEHNTVNKRVHRRHNSVNQAAIDHRRRAVTGLLVRGLTQREIEQALAEQKIVNPETGKPYALGTINADVLAIRAEWRKEALAEITEHKARLFAELQEVKRAAWGISDYANILKAIKQESELLGTDAPKQIAGSQTGEIVFRVVYEDPVE